MAVEDDTGLVAFLERELDVDLVVATAAEYSPLVIMVSRRGGRTAAHAYWSRYSPARAVVEIGIKHRLIAGWRSACEWADDSNCPPEQRDAYLAMAAGMYDALRMHAEGYSDRPGWLEEWRL